MSKSIFLTVLLFSFSVAQARPIDIEKDFLEKIVKLAEGEKPDHINYAVKKVSEFPEHSHLSVSVGERIVLRLEYDKKAQAQPALLLPDALLLSYMRNYSAEPIAGLKPKANLLLKTFGPKVGPYTVVELVVDAQAGSLSAQARLERWKAAVIEGLIVENEFENQFPGTKHAVAKRLVEMRAKIAQLNARAASAALPSFDRNRLREFVARNDRKGAADYLRTSLNWQVLQPVEAKAWRGWLESIESPSEENSLWLFRGFQSERGFKNSFVANSNGGGFLSFSQTGTIQHFDSGRDAISETISEGGCEIVAKVADALFTHAEAEAGPSIFISLSPDFSVAEGFVRGTERFPGSPGELLAVKLDSRRLIPNFASDFGREFEFLVPLVIFPDEVMRLATNYSSEADQPAFLAAIGAMGYLEDKNSERAAAIFAKSSELYRLAP